MGYWSTRAKVIGAGTPGTGQDSGNLKAGGAVFRVGAGEGQVVFSPVLVVGC